MAIGRRSAVRLPAGAVGVWALDLDDPGWDVDRAAVPLSGTERARAERGTSAVRRRRILVRSALRQVLGELLDLAPADVPIDVDGGRPVVAGPRRHRRVQVSCSASAGVALVGVAVGIPIGIDVQRIGNEDLADAVAEGWLAAAERTAVEELPPEEHAGALTRAWVQKEAVLKGRGVGLQGDPGQVVTPGADRGRSGGWSLVPVPVTEGYVASLAVARNRPPRMVLHELVPPEASG
jgi:4'-phosphopantetheinyl transferase